MSAEWPQVCKISIEAGADLSAKQFYHVKMSANNKCIVCAGVTDIPIGILQNKPISGATAEVLVIGGTKVSSDAALTAGALIGTSTDGQAAAYVAGTDTTKYVTGQVVEGSGAVGGLASAIINCANLNRAA